MASNQVQIKLAVIGNKNIILNQETVQSCFSRSVNFGAATMENGFQVTILDSEALES